MGVSLASFYTWKKKCTGFGIAELRRLKSLEDENRKLKQLVADLTLDKHVLQDLATNALRGASSIGIPCLASKPAPRAFGPSLPQQGARHGHQSTQLTSPFFPRISRNRRCTTTFCLGRFECPGTGYVRVCGRCRKSTQAVWYSRRHSGRAVTTAGYTGSIVALALHKRSQVHLGDSATFVSTARNQYAQCYTGWGSWDAINAACKATFVTTAAGLNCARHALWYMAD